MLLKSASKLVQSGAQIIDLPRQHSSPREMERNQFLLDGGCVGGETKIEKNWLFPRQTSGNREFESTLLHHPVVSSCCLN